ncbi:MAG: hypothetical protein KAJ24_03830 [Candidatus Aenigmarchaeota archaeon]|nr:hypothetical protein [Candidatus Aenigmarchaeota archaeon]
MIFNIFGIADLLAAIILFLGDFPGPSWLVKICIIVLALKGLMSMFPLPMIFPFASPLGMIDIVASLLLFFGNAPVPNILITAVAIVLAVKGVVSVLPELFKFIG